MRRSRYGMIAGMAGAAFATWWLRRRRQQAARTSAATTDQGQVIFSNAPLT